LGRLQFVKDSGVAHAFRKRCVSPGDFDHHQDRHFSLLVSAGSAGIEQLRSF
jgi:hypothetical protein